MLSEFLKSTVAWLKRVVTQPREELSRWQRAARFAYDLGRFGGRQLRQDRAPQMAAALAFRTLFALLPVLIVSMIVVKATQGVDAFTQLIRDMLASLGLDTVRIVPSNGIATGPGTGSLSLAAWLEELIGQAADVNLAAVGWVGAALIGYAAISLMVTIESSFNIIFRAPEGRPWTRRIPLYWFILTVSPVAMGVAWFLNSQFATWIEVVQGWQTLLFLARLAWSLFSVWLVLLGVYSLMPNTRVALRYAAIGAFVAALLFEIGKRFLDAYLGNAFAVSQLYGSLGLVPLFMFWVYLMWLATLFGLEVCAILQTLGGRSLTEIQPKAIATGMVEPAAVVTVMTVIAERFAEGASSNARRIAETTSLPESVVALMIDRLVDAGYLHQVDGESSAVTLARPPENVSVGALIDIGFDITDHGGDGPHDALLERLRDVQRELLAETTLATLGAK